MNQGWTYRDQISQGGQTVLQYYVQRYQHSSKHEWRERIQRGQVQVNDRPVSPETLLKSGDLLIYHRPPWEEPSVPLSFGVLYEDDDVVAVDKPSGLPVMPGGGFLEHTLLHQLQLRYPDRVPIPIHRLGRGTSGIVLSARSPQAKSSLSQQMRDRSLSKIYRTLIERADLPDAFSINTPIGPVPHPYLGTVFAANDRGKDARSDCRVLRRSHDSTLLEVDILTGRPHQIRIHLASIGYPLLGDPLYISGGSVRLGDSAETTPVPGDCGYDLHAHRLIFTHPESQRRIAVEAPLPPELI
ncbi:MAG: RluA family pseudouridine synthase [Cyanobacteria bacterium P01_A01_bin.3]